MAKRMTPEQVFDDLLNRYGPELAQAFLDAIADLKSGVEFQRLVTALEQGNIQAALEALHLDDAALDPVEAKLREAFLSGGQAGAQALPARNPDGLALVIRFSIRNPEAERWLREHSSRLITRIMEEQRATIREALDLNMQAGNNPRTAALDIVGRVNNATGAREGGVIGLTQAQAGYVRNARQELTQGDAAGLRAYLGRERRDKRFDPTIKKALANETRVPAETIRKALVAYERRLLELRGQMIGRTEALTSLRAAQHESVRQAVESGAIPEISVRRIWRSASDTQVRDTHQALNGDSVGLNGVFRSPSGALMRFPGDTSLGAGAGEIVACRCAVSIRVDWLANLT